MCVLQVWERFTDQCVYESDRFGGGSVMIWAGICHDGHTQLNIVHGTLNAVKYRDEWERRVLLLLLISFLYCHESQLTY